MTRAFSLVAVLIAALGLTGLASSSPNKNVYATVFILQGNGSCVRVTTNPYLPYKTTRLTLTAPPRELIRVINGSLGTVRLVKVAGTFPLQRERISGSGLFANSWLITTVPKNSGQSLVLSVQVTTNKSAAKCAAATITIKVK